ncbi:hypothetical protein [Tepidimonas sp.]|uniref:hypothetical protein n=1 Tax=Tepidimonas sp. TaxID=2002775 RepID=UPI00391B8512
MYLSPWILGVIGFGFLGVYLFIAIEVQRMTQPGDWAALLAHVFFFASANVIGLMAAWQRQRLLHEGFRLRQRLSTELQRTVVEPNVDVPLGASVGVAQYPQDGYDGARLLQVADARMYGTKAAHRQARGASVLPDVEGASGGMAQSRQGGRDHAGPIGAPVPPR